MAKSILTAERLRELLSYDPETGVFEWKHRAGFLRSGKTAGYLSPNGGVYIDISRRHHPAHRLAWLYMTGAWPTADVDHINGVRKDNRFSNLRDVAHAVNTQNRRFASKDNVSGFLGVTAIRGKYMARICKGGKNVYLGSYETPERAHAVYIEHKRAIHEGCTI